MTNRTTVNISLTPELDSFVHNCLDSGRYQTVSEVVREGLRLLERHQRDRDNGMLRLLTTRFDGGVFSTDFTNLDRLMEELREMVDERRRSKEHGVIE